MPRKTVEAGAAEESTARSARKSSWTDAAQEFLLGSVKNLGDNIVQFLLGFEARFHEFIGRLVRRAFVYILLIIGLIFVFIGLAMALADAFDLGPGGGYIVVGILIFCLSFVFHIFSRK